VWIAQANGNTQANGRWFVRALSATTLELAGSIGNGSLSGTAVLMPFAGSCASAAGLTLGSGSQYRSGVAYTAPAGPPGYGSAGKGPASDGANVGADPAAVAAATGAVTFQGVQPSANGAQFSYTAHAGTGETCTVDVSADGFASFTRVADSGTGTARTTAVSGLNGSTAYQYRLLCPSVTLAGSFVTSPLAANLVQGAPEVQGAAGVF
jgi:hypothetical protein